ncbi:hypothetical protein KAZ92_02420 [Candidatus Gracilibacteria bacterium]|nr:hypothetical protein [Candidatus Gracilibacteria bacterium]
MKLSSIGVSLGMVALLALTGCGGGFSVGDKVVGNWKGGDRWWNAQVTAVAGDQVTVKYDDDSSTETLAKTSAAHLPSGAASVKVGDRVIAKWTDSKFYNGTVTALNGDKATISWTSGSPTDVALTDITVAGK